MMTELLLLIIFILFVLEIIIFSLIIFTRKNFQWLIIKKDIAPEINRKLAKNFIDHSFNLKLGWMRKGPTKFSDNTPEGLINYTIDKNNCRFNPVNQNRKSTIAIYGDSFAFGRLVSDDNTLAAFLSKELNTHVNNYGVGNFGIDQALLRLEGDINNLQEKVIVMCVVPETIVRIRSFWKHYFEYGNILAFKPMYEIENGNLKIVPNKINSINKLMNYKTHLKEIQNKDYFFEEKFKKDILKFPFLFSLFSNLKRNLFIIYYNLLGIISFKRNLCKRKAFEIIIKENAHWAKKLYKDKYSCDLLRKIVERFSELCLKKGKKPILFIIPQYYDLNIDFINSYKTFLNSLNFRELKILEASEIALENKNEGYIDGPLGPHPSKKLNSCLAKYLKEKIKNCV